MSCEVIGCEVNEILARIIDENREVLDKLLYQYIERRLGPKEIKAQGFDSALVDRVLKMVNMNEYKRNQFCPIIRISPKAFGIGRRMPIVGK